MLRMLEADLAGRPREHAWLHALVGARYLQAGDRRRGLGYLASGIAVANGIIAARIVRYYAPFAVKRLLRPSTRFAGSAWGAPGTDTKSRLAGSVPVGEGV